MDFASGYFSKAFSRMVFHGLINSVDDAAREIHRVLKPGGKFILSEGIPPDRSAEEWYTEMFRLKEERLTFFPETLEKILSRAGFSDMRIDIHVSRQVSIRNWLEYSGLPDSRQQEIMQTHLAMPQDIRRAYRATFSQDQDVLLDMKFAIVVGTKPGR
jgi:SAM-dependent methyltransferase